MGNDLKAQFRPGWWSWAVLAWLVVWGSIAQGQLHPLLVPPISEAALQQAVDPIPIQRVLVAPNRVAAELERARQGVVQQMPRAEFESLVRRAARTSQAANKLPRLLEARYRGVLEDGAIVGTSEWTVENPAGGTGVLPLPSFNLALRQARLGNSGAIIGNWDGKTAGLLVDRPGKNVVSMVWSVRSDRGPSGLRFEIKLPPCILSSFDLDLPADRSLTVSGETCLLSARPADSTAHRRQWRIDCAGASQLDLLVRESERQGQPPPLVLSRLQTRQKLAANLMEADFELVLEVFHGAIRNIQCECDPVLSPTMVRVRSTQIETWEWRPGASPDEPGLLNIRLPEAVRDSSVPVQVHCLASCLPNKRWTCPGIKVTGAVPLGENLAIHLAPEIRLEDWHHGNFEFTKVATDPEAAQTLFLRSGIQKAAPEGKPDSGSGLERPSARITIPQPEVQAQSSTWWRVTPDGSSVITHVSYRVVRGRLLNVPILIPSDWSVDRVELTPPEIMRTWTMLPQEDGHSTLGIELRRPMDPQEIVQIRIGMGPREREGAASFWKSPSRSVQIIFPEVIPQNARLVRGELAISVNPSYQTSVTASRAETSFENVVDSEKPLTGKEAKRNSTASSAFPSPPPPWGAETPTYYYVYQGQPVSGILSLQNRPARVRARCTTDIVVDGERCTMSIRLDLEPLLGSAETIDLFVSPPVTELWNWKGAAVQETRPLPIVEIARCLTALGAGTSVVAATDLAMPLPSGTWWQLRLKQPLREPLTLETTLWLPGTQQRSRIPSCFVPFAGSTLPETITWMALGQRFWRTVGPEGPWQVPLFAVLNADPMEGQVRLHIDGSHQLQVEAHGLREKAVTDSGATLPVTSSFSYTHPPFSLVLRAPLPLTGGNVTASADRAHLTTYVDPQGRAVHVYRLQIRHWAESTLPVCLPPGARLLAARVDQRWVSAPARFETGSEGTVLNFPVVAGTGLHNYEICYEVIGRAWWLGEHVDAPSPRLPLPVLALRHTWCLPAGLTPFFQERYNRLPGPAKTSTDKELGNLVREALGCAPASSLSGSNRKQSQHEYLKEIDTYLRAQLGNGKELALGETLSSLLFGLFKGEETLVVDVAALAEIGVNSATPIFSHNTGLIADGHGTGSVENSHLVWVLSGNIPLLTTRTTRDAWHNADVGQNSLSSSIAEAVAQAAMHGQDPSGRFRNVGDWLEREPPARITRSNRETPPPANLAALPGTSLWLRRFDSWTEWESLPGQGNEESLLVLRHDVLSGIAWALTGVFFLAGWRARLTSGRRGYALLLLGLVVAGLSILWLPVALRGLVIGPAAAGVIVAAIWFLRFALTTSVAAGASKPSNTAGGVLGLLVWCSVSGNAQAPSAYTVLVLSGPADSPQAMTALVPPPLLDQLQTLAQRDSPNIPAVLLHSAKYEGSVKDGNAELKAHFQIHCFSDRPTAVTVPLGGIELQEALLDGIFAYPVALATPQTGFALTVKGQGNHSLEVRFTARVVGSGEDQELRFGIPELHQSMLLLHVTAGAHYLQSVGGRGIQRITRTTTTTQLEADLGRVGSLQVRWRRESSRPVAVNVQVKEYYLWDLHPAASRLLGILQYVVNQGATTTLTIDLPEDTEVRRVETGPVPGSGTGPRLKDWSLAGEGPARRLQLEFQAPITQGMQVYLELVPSLPLGRQVVLSPPTPRDSSLSEGFLAYRAQGWQTSLAEYQRVTGIEATDFANRWPLTVGEQPPRPDKAYSFRRISGATPFLKLNLLAPSASVKCLQELTWQVGEQQVNLQAKTALTASKEDLSMLEWEIPPEVVLTDLRGADLRSWSRTGSRIQVWLERSLEQTTIEFAGWLPRPPQEPSTPVRLPYIHCLSSASQTSLVRMTAPKGWELRPQGLRNLRPLPEPQIDLQDRTYVALGTAYAGSFQPHAASPSAHARIWTWAAVRDQQLVVQAAIDCRLGSSELRDFIVRVRNWEGQDIHLEGPGLIGNEERTPNPAERVWRLQLRPENTGRFQITLLGKRGLSGGQELLLPDISVARAARQERWISVAEQDFVVAETRGLRPTTGSAPVSPPWPAGDLIRQTGDPVWRIETEDWSARLTPRFYGGAQRRILVLLDEQAAAIVDNRHWLHQATYWLYQEGESALRVALPDDAILVRAALNGRPVLLPHSDRERHSLPLVGNDSPHVLRLWWRFNEASERLERPNLQRPRLEGVEYGTSREQASTLWHLQAPPGHRFFHEGRDARAVNSGARDWSRAVAYYLVSKSLSESSFERHALPLERLTNAQKSFYTFCRYAEYHLGLNVPERQPSPNDQGLATQLEQIREANKQLANKYGFESIRAQAEKQNAAGLAVSIPEVAGGTTEMDTSVLDERGTPTYWQAESDSAIPRLHLVGLNVHAAQQALGYSGLLVVLALSAWIVSYSSKFVRLAQALWPEEVALLGLVAWQTLGAHVAFALLVFLGLSIRLWRLGSWTASTRRRKLAAATASGVSSTT